MCHHMALVCQHRQDGNVPSHRKSVHASGDNTAGVPYRNRFFSTAVLASCWSLMAKIVQKQKSRSSADVRGGSWVAPKLHQLSPEICCALRDKSPCADLLDPTASRDHLCSSSVPRHVWGARPLEGVSVRTRGCWSALEAPLEIKPRAECGNYINQLIIPHPVPPVYSSVTDLGFFAFL